MTTYLGYALVKKLYKAYKFNTDDYFEHNLIYSMIIFIMSKHSGIYGIIIKDIIQKE